MKLTDYKFWFIRRDDAGYIEEAAVRFYEGKIQKVKQKDKKTGEEKEIDHYIRTKRLTDNDLSHLGGGFIVDSLGNKAKRYTPADFGWIKEDEELRQFLNKELAKDKQRVAIKEQRI